MELLLEFISLTCLLLGVFLSVIITICWNLGHDFKIKGNYGRRLNVFEKFFDGFCIFLKM